MTSPTPLKLSSGRHPLRSASPCTRTSSQPAPVFFKAALKPEWLTDPTKPVDLQHEESEVFSRYLNCVYCGTEALQIDADAPEDDRSDSGDNNEDDFEAELGPDAFLCSEAEFARPYEEGINSRGKYVKYIYQCHDIFTDLYLLADRLRDIETANLVMDALICFRDKGGKIFDTGVVRRVYDSTVHGNPLRKLVRDECVYDTQSWVYMDLHAAGYHPEFARDVMVEFLRVKDFNAKEKVEAVYQMHGKHGKHGGFAYKCRYSSARRGTSSLCA